MPLMTTVHVGRSLGDLFVAPGRGVKDVAFTTTSLVNLVVGLALNEPVHARENVSRFGELRLSTTDETFSSLEEQANRSAQIKAAETGSMELDPAMVWKSRFTDTLVHYVDRLRGPERDSLLPFVGYTRVDLMRAAGGMDMLGCYAAIQFGTEPRRRVTAYYNEPSSEAYAGRDLAICEIRQIRGELLLGIADLLRGDDARRASKKNDPETLPEPRGHMIDLHTLLTKTPAPQQIRTSHILSMPQKSARASAKTLRTGLNSRSSKRRRPSLCPSSTARPSFERLRNTRRPPDDRVR